MTENVMKLAVRNNKKSNVKTYPSRTWMKNKMNDPYLFDEENVEEVFSIKPLKPSFQLGTSSMNSKVTGEGAAAAAAVQKKALQFSAINSDF